MKLKTFRNIIIVISLVILAFGWGYQAGQKNIGVTKTVGESISSSDTRSGNIDLSLFWDVWNRLSRYYIDKKAMDTQKMVYGAISGMVSSLGDPYTVFLPPQQNKEAKDDLGGKFEGIGVQLGIKDKKIVVIAALKGTPAEKAGLKPQDIILKVDGEDTLNWTLPYAVSKIRGEKGTAVKLTVYKNESSSSAEIQVKRDTINVASVEEESLNVKCLSKCEIVKDKCDGCDKVAYLKLSRFGDQTNDEWIKVVDEISSKSWKGLVFDLRNNPGGYLSGSVFIASEFLKDGTVVTQDSAKTGKQVYTVNRNGKLLDIPLVVLINKGTASAGEIVAGALKDRGRAKLVGDTSFGKGSVQEAQELKDGAGIHITVAKWLLPSGKWINGTGVDPDIKISNNDNKPSEDLQLTKAVEVLSGKN